MIKKKLFFSYNFADKDVVAKIYHELSRVNAIQVYFFDEVLHSISWQEDIEKAISNCDWFVFFMGSNYGETQKKEAKIFESEKKKRSELQRVINIVKIKLINCEMDKFNFSPTGNLGTIVVKSDDRGEADYWSCINELVTKYLKEKIEIGDDLPVNPHLFDYEKNIIDFFLRKKHLCKERLGRVDVFDEAAIDKLLQVTNITVNEIKTRLFLPENYSLIGYQSLNLSQKTTLLKSITDEIHKKLEDGCPSEWPKVECKDVRLHKNTVEDTGDFRRKDAYVLAAALSIYHNSSNSLCMMAEGFYFPEAGPREMLYYPKYCRGSQNTFRVAVLVSGGIAPGINAVIDGITQRHYKYRKEDEIIEVWGLKKGFQAFQNIDANRVYLLSNEKFAEHDKTPNLVTSDHINEGGSIIGTSREEALLWHRERIDKLKDIVTKLKNNHIRILYVIGGDGSMKAAHTIHSLAKKIETEDWDLSVVGIPKTMDNDILWVWQTFGFVSAVEKAREFIDNLANEVKSNPRLGIVQLFGSESGFVVSHAVLASRTGICDIALIPEVPFSMKALGRTLDKKFKQKRGEYGLIVMAETAIPTDAMDYVDYPETMPLYLSQNYFKNKILNNDEIDTELRDKLMNCYKIDIRGHYVFTNSLDKKEEEIIIENLHKNNLIKYVNFDEIRRLNIDIEKDLFSSDDQMMINERFLAENWNDFVPMLNSIGYNHYINIGLSDDEKITIRKFTMLRNKNQRIQGQTDDYLRNAGLKIVSKGILKLGIHWGRRFRVLTNEPRHLLRAIPPSTIDIIFGNRLGTLAVDNAMSGYSDFMISQWLTEFALVPLKLVVLGRKRIPSNGIFWKSVLTKTGQPTVMV